MKAVYFVISCFMLCIAFNLNAAICGHSLGETENYLIPDLKLQWTPCPIEDTVAFSFITETGRRNFRVNGTGAYLIDSCQGLKISAEYLAQKLGYNFTTGRVDQWVQQGAVGGAYQRDLDLCWLPSFEISTFYSYALGKDLATLLCQDNITSIGRHIAGSEAVGGTLGITACPWEASRLVIQGNYDHVRYRRHFSNNLHVSGFGATFDFQQNLFNEFDLRLRTEFRRPFNYYKASINFPVPICSNDISVGFFGSYTAGKSFLPNNTVVGIELSYPYSSINCNCSSCYTCDSHVADDCCSNSCQIAKLISWVSTPAVYLPEVLAIVDPLSVFNCIAPTSTTIPNQTITTPTYAINVSPFFSDPTGTQPLTFSAVGLPALASINPATGVITGTNPFIQDTFTVTVTATNLCGSTSQTFLIIFPD